MAGQVAREMSNDSDHEDVDVFVSPRHFGGRTPGPKATAQKVFEEEKAKANAREQSQDEAMQALGFEGVKYKYDSERGGTFNRSDI